MNTFRTQRDNEMIFLLFIKWVAQKGVLFDNNPSLRLYFFSRKTLRGDCCEFTEEMKSSWVFQQKEKEWNLHEDLEKLNCKEHSILIVMIKTWPRDEFSLLMRIGVRVKKVLNLRWKGDIISEPDWACVQDSGVQNVSTKSFLWMIILWMMRLAMQ